MIATSATTLLQRNDALPPAPQRNDALAVAPRPAPPQRDDALMARADIGAFNDRVDARLRAMGVEREQLLASQVVIDNLEEAERAVEPARSAILEQAEAALLAQAERLDARRVLALLD